MQIKINKKCISNAPLFRKNERKQRRIALWSKAENETIAMAHRTFVRESKKRIASIVVFMKTPSTVGVIWFKGQIKAKDIFIDFHYLRPRDFKISNQILK